VATSTSRVNVSQDYYDDGLIQSNSQAWNYDDPSGSSTKTVSFYIGNNQYVLTHWTRDASNSWGWTTPSSWLSLFAEAEQYSEYFNNDFCPIGCGETRVGQYTIAIADRNFPASHFADVVPYAWGSYYLLISQSITRNETFGGCIFF
jgi:hypothetical protein